MILSVVAVVLTLFGPPGYPVRSNISSPSAFCHTTDGAFTTCGDGNAEWSDIPATEFAARQAFLYADQADLIPDRGVPGLPYDTFMLLYDECGRTTPLGPNEYFLVSFDTVETEDEEEFERYAVRVFPDGTIIFLENGEIQRDSAGRARVREIEGQTGRAGFGQSPQCPFDHLVVEYQIDLDAAGGHSYSPDPLFWGGTPPEVPPTAGDDNADLGDDIGKDIEVLANDSDSDGSIVPSTVAVVDRPGHGTIHIGASGVVRYDKGADFEDADSFSYTVQDNDGATSNTATVTVVGNCATDVSIPVALPPVTGTGIVLGLLKGYRVSYDPLDLTFSTRPVRPGAYCSLDSNTGVLGVRLTCLGTLLNLCPSLFPRFVPIQVATSTASASLDFFRPGSVAAPPVCDFIVLGNSNNCMLNSPSADGILVRWQTSGFVIRESFLGNTLRSTGPLTFWANLNGVAPAKAPLAEKVSRVETLLHTTLVSHLSAVDRFSIIQDPPAEILVTDQGSRRTGRTDTGEIVNEIPGAVYTTSAEGASTVLILEPAASSYEVKVHGAVGEEFSLSMAVIDIYGDATSPAVTEQRASGRLEPGGNLFYFDVPVEHRPPLPRNAIRSGFDSTELQANDDSTAGPIPLGFQADFFGRTFTDVFVNNNGNLTFDQALPTFTPFDLSATERAIIAPFFADVDTTRGATTRYGTGTVDGRPAFGATWPGVRCFNPEGAPEVPPRNEFQVVLVDRSDIGAGDFDIEFNYDKIQWEAGTASGADTECRGGAAARIGFAKGTSEPGTFFELPGSGVPGAFLDGNGDGTALIQNSRNSNQLGRYRFTVRNGDPHTSDADGDSVPDDLDNCPHTSNTDQRDANLNGIGDACGPSDRLHSTAGFLQARLDGRTSAEPIGGTLGDEPGLRDRLLRIVEFRLAQGLATDAEELTTNLVNSLVSMGLVAAGEAPALIQSVLDQVGPPSSPSPSVPPSSTSPSPSASAGGVLGRTGISLIPIAVIGISLTGAGVLLLLLLRRRRRGFTAT